MKLMTPALCAVLVLLPMAASADESPFAAIYTTELLPAGGTEIEQWLTWRTQRPHESFNALEGRTEYEYGITENFQLAGYLNYDWTRENAHPAALGGAESGTNFTGVSAEAIYRLANVYTDPVGVALYLEPRIGPGQREIEAKILLQKNFLDDRLIFAANAVLEHEWELAPPDPTAPPGSPDASHHWEKETELNFLLGMSYRFAEGWSGGIEFRAKREIDGLLFWQPSHEAAASYFIGPTLHYAQDSWWLTGGVQAQLPWAANLSGEADETINGYAHEEERYRATFRFGIEL